MDDKNELNDLLMGNQKESSGSGKKIFLISAGVLLLSFVGIGIMKFVGSSDTKQPLPITSIEPAKKPDGAPVSVAASNALSQADINGSAPVGEDKLNEIVKKLQEDAQSKADGSIAPSQSVAPQTTTPTGEPIQPIDPKATAAAAQIKALSENTKKEEPKKTNTEAPKHTTPQPKPIAKEESTPSSKETYYVQVGYFKNDAPIKELQNKIKVAGYGAIIKPSSQNDKNISKVWVGPFESKTEAEKSLPKIRTKIKNDAFVVKE